MIHTQTRTARKTHHCSRCQTPIRPGERHNAHTAFPHDNDLGNTGFWRLRECADCAEAAGRPVDG